MEGPLDRDKIEGLEHGLRVAAQKLDSERVLLDRLAGGLPAIRRDLERLLATVRETSPRPQSGR